MHEANARYPWLKAETASGSLPFFSDYYDMDYRIKRTDDYLELHTWGYGGELRFIVHSDKEVDHTEGCTAEIADEGVYIVRTSEAQSRIYWKGEL